MERKFLGFLCSYLREAIHPPGGHVLQTMFALAFFVGFFAFFNKSSLLVAMFLTDHVRLCVLDIFVQGGLVIISPFFSILTILNKQDILRFLYR